MPEQIKSHQPRLLVVAIIIPLLAQPALAFSGLTATTPRLPLPLLSPLLLASPLLVALPPCNAELLKLSSLAPATHSLGFKRPRFDHSLLSVNVSEQQGAPVSFGCRVLHLGDHSVSFFFCFFCRMLISCFNFFFKIR